MNEWKKLCKICFKVGLCWTWHSLIRCLLPTHWGFFFYFKDFTRFVAKLSAMTCMSKYHRLQSTKSSLRKIKMAHFHSFWELCPRPIPGIRLLDPAGGFPFSDSCQCPSQTKIAAPCDWQSVYCTACCAQLTLLFANGWKTSRKSRTKTWNYCAKWRIQKIIRFRGWKTKTFCHKMLGVYLFIYFKFDIAVKLLKQYDGDR